MNNIYNEFTEPRTRAADRLTWQEIAGAVAFVAVFYFVGLVLWACLA